MSEETMQVLNTEQLIGFTEKRGFAWHYRADLQGAESNHYPGAIPVDDVMRRLFSWTAEERPIYIPTTSEIASITLAGGPNDGQSVAHYSDRKAIVRSDTNALLGIFKSGYAPHQYPEWLIEKVIEALGLANRNDLGVASAGLLRGGARAYVSVEVPDTIETPEGVSFRPFILAYTSFDGSLATDYGRKVQLVVCDNTLEIARAESGQNYRLRHSKYSTVKNQELKDALQILHTAGDDFSREVAELCAVKVSAKQFDTVLDTLIPVPSEDGRGKTRAENRQAEIRGLYNGDARCAPWAGTAFGVVQAFNTNLHHNATQKGGVSRGARNMDNVLQGAIAKHDGAVLDALHAALV